MLTIQYLEPGPEIETLDPVKVFDKLQKALDLLPLTHLIIGWKLPQSLIEGCKKITQAYAVRLMRWQPLLTFNHPPIVDELQVINAFSEPIAGFANMPEFTFFCPNHPDAWERVQADLVSQIQSGFYEGFFLDRIRYPSPSEHPYRDLGCFCQFCKKKAESFDLDLSQLQKQLCHSYQQKQSPPAFLECFSEKPKAETSNEPLLVFERFMAFRAQSIWEFVQQSIEEIHLANLEVGLDAFSPAIAYMVGQSLPQLTPLADWTKVMSYAHTLGPAGLPFELSNLAQFLIGELHLPEQQALEQIQAIFDLQLPSNLATLSKQGLAPSTLAQEITRAVLNSPKPILAGIELVEIPQVAELNDCQIEADLVAVKNTQPAGLAISWDLWHIPLHRLELVKRIWN